MIPLPEEFKSEIQEMLGAEAPAFFAALDEAPTLALRLNPKRKNAEAAAAAFSGERVPWEKLGRYLLPDTKPGASVAHAAGAFYLQEASAMLSVAALDPRPGECILDLCAAPGGKSGQIAGRMAGRGLLMSNEIEPSRARVLASNLERLGVGNAVVVNARPDLLSRCLPGHFDALLCDAPCSGEGMFRREIEARSAWQPGSPAGCARRQAEILDSAAALLRPGGRLVYSTCTFNRSENERTIDAFLARHPEFSREDFEIDGLGRSEGGMMRIWPQRVRGDGHFCARLRKAGNMPSVKEGDRLPNSVPFVKEGDRLPNSVPFVKEGDRLPNSVPPLKGEGDRLRWRGSSSHQPDRETMAAINQLQREICSLPDGDYRYLRMNDNIIAVPALCPDLKGLHVISGGVNLMKIGRSHIEPLHALAMTADADAARQCADLTEADALRYLLGETLPCAANMRGWVLVTCREMPLGWAKAADGVLKNHLPKGLRIRR